MRIKRKNVTALHPFYPSQHRNNLHTLNKMLPLLPIPCMKKKNHNFLEHSLHSGVCIQQNNKKKYFFGKKKVENTNQ